jgi:hypothetical protein
MAEVSMKITELVTKERQQQVKLNTRMGRKKWSHKETKTMHFRRWIQVEKCGRIQ